MGNVNTRLASRGPRTLGRHAHVVEAVYYLLAPVTLTLVDLWRAV